MIAPRLKTSGALLAAALALVGGYEGLSLVAYRDGGGVPTICRGSTEGVRMGDVASEAECNARFARDLLRHEAAMAACIKRPGDVPEKAYLAFLSFTYNVGGGAFCGSTLARKLNAGDLAGACNELPRWNRDNGRVVRGLTKRRISERALCMEALQ